MSKNGYLIVYNNLYSGVTKAGWMPQLIPKTLARSHVCQDDQAYICLIHFYKRCVCILRHSSIVVLFEGLKTAC